MCYFNWKYTCEHMKDRGNFFFFEGPSLLLSLFPIIRASKHHKIPYQLQALPSAFQGSARDATFVPRQRARKADLYVINAISLCAKSTANACSTNESLQWGKIIRRSQMKCCGILFHTFSHIFCFCTEKVTWKVIRQICLCFSIFVCLLYNITLWKIL